MNFHATTPTHRATRTLLAAAMLCAIGSAQADPQPTGATDGVAFDNPAEGVTNITAPDGAIIDYASFDVATGETVNFIQPGAAARVLNRINSSTPTQINGTVNANGVIYFVNPSGVRFGPDSVVDAAGVYAASLSSAIGSNTQLVFMILKGIIQIQGRWTEGGVNCVSRYHN